MARLPFWDGEVETLPVQDLKRLQCQRLEEVVEKAQTAPFYKERLRNVPFRAGRFEPLDAVRFFPFTTKEDMRSQFPYGLLAVPLDDCVRAHASSGTTGQAVAILHTRQDIATWSNTVARCLYGVGVDSSAVFQNMAGYGLFTGGLGFHYGAELVGALTIPAGAGNSRQQIHLMRHFGTTAAHLMPSFALYLKRVCTEMGMDPKRETKLETFFLGAEPHSEQTRSRIEDFFGVDAYNSYGLSEMNGPGVTFECPMKQGLHVWEDNFLLELIDPDGDEPVPEGSVGELVYTSLTREAMPLIRYRSRDLAASIAEPCACGRTHRRISRIQGRIDDMIIFKGVNLFPTQVEDVLMEMDEIDENFLIKLEGKCGVETLTVQVEADELCWSREKREQVRKRVARSLQSELQVGLDVQLLARGSLPDPEGTKKSRVLDQRFL